ncbi:MAG TPA: AMP-binding protein [Stellaceae bacterium]|nr:AMP-binding protein [Stellaceae bacterium]
MRTIDYFDRAAERWPDRMALVAGDLRLSFAEVRAATRRIAAAMAASGIAVQEPVAVYGPNSGDVLLCLLGLWRARGVWVPVNSRNALPANIAYLNYVRAGWLFYHSSVAEDAKRLLAEVPTLRHAICLDRALDAHPSLARFMTSGDGIEPPDWGDAYGNPHELVGIIPTGGTTGPAKGVRVANLGWGTMVETAMGAWDGRTDDPVCLTVAPLTHAAGPVATACLAFGATIVVMPGFDALGVMEHIERYRVSHMFLPPTALYSLLAHPRVREFDYSSLRIMLLAGSAVSPDKFREAVGIFGPCLCQSYGQTESPMLTTWLPPEAVAAAAAGDHPERLASCGLPTRSVRVGIMDDAGNLLPPGEAGEIVVRGALVSEGYFELPTATQDVRTFGWHHTGDVARRDADGYVYIVDRKKDMIVTGGFNVFSAEVEAAVMELPQIRECAVIGVPDDHWGEAVKAIVVGAGIEAAAVIEHCKARLGGVKAPKSVEFWPEIPRTPAGKFDKKAIRGHFWQDTTRNVH